MGSVSRIGPSQSIASELATGQESGAASPARVESTLRFSEMLASVQRAAAPVQPPPNRWQHLGFLTGGTLRFPWTWSQTAGRAAQALAAGALAGALAPHLSPTQPAVARPQPGVAPGSRPLALDEYPHPPGDNGRGIHWIPTVSQPPEVVDRFVEEARAMRMKWVVFLNDGSHTGANDYLVKRLVEAGIEPVMRVYTAGLVPIEGDLRAMVRHYRQMGVRYFQLYNEPNLLVETGGRQPDVDRYLDLWVPAAKQVIEAGGLPGFGALSPQGDVDDREFLRQALARLEARGELAVLDRAWLASHNYSGARSLNDPDGFLRFRQYDAIIRSALGRSLPIIGTEGGAYAGGEVSEERQIATVAGAYEYMRHREPYNFAYSYWIIANGHDPAWDNHALFRPGGPTRLATVLKEGSSGGIV